MRFPISLQTSEFWEYVDEADGRDLDLSYPSEIIKAVKRAYFDKGPEWFVDKERTEFTFFIPNPQNNVPYEVTLKPNICKALKMFFKDQVSLVSGMACPSNDSLINIFCESDKFFSMMLALRKDLPIISTNIKLGNYHYAAITIASLVKSYNLEIIELINQYFEWHSYFIKDQDIPGRMKHIKYFLVPNKTYIMSNIPYIAILIYQYDDGEYYYPEDKKTKDPYHLKLLYENYNVLQIIDDKHRVKPSGSFLQDCRNIIQMKKQTFFDEIGLIEFRDLMQYGYYSDKILSIEVMKEVSNIFGQKKWQHDFFLILSLYCNKIIEIQKQELSDSKEVIDTSKLPDYDLFIKVIKYYDSIYESLLVKTEK